MNLFLLKTLATFAASSYGAVWPSTSGARDKVWLRDAALVLTIEDDAGSGGGSL